MSRDPLLYLEDIAEGCERIRRYTAGQTEAQFAADGKTYDAVLRNLETIGEAAKNLAEEIRAGMPEIEWKKICAFRDVLAHHYFGVDPGIVWDVMVNKLPALESAVRSCIAAAAG